MSRRLISDLRLLDRVTCSEPGCLALKNSTKRNNRTGKSGRGRVYAVVVIVSVVLVLVGVAAYYDQMSVSRPNVTDTTTTAAKFRALSQAHTDTCANIGNKQANINYINSLGDSTYLQGSCCTPMHYSHYVSQVNGLKNYTAIQVIPEDPYNVSAVLAKQMTSYVDTNLTPTQQAVYDSAVSMSGEGPCCCQCWAWYAHEGLAKALISQYGWNAQQVSNIWKLEDCCGGT